MLDSNDLIDLYIQPIKNFSAFFLCLIIPTYKTILYVTDFWTSEIVKSNHLSIF